LFENSWKYRGYFLTTMQSISEIGPPFEISYERLFGRHCIFWRPRGAFALAIDIPLKKSLISKLFRSVSSVPGFFKITWFMR
jgi:hypothetical protein